jgi:secreted protein with Ig-like and vWFA domain
MSKVPDKVVKNLRKSIKDIYNNYGIDVSDMGDDEFGRLIKQYLNGDSNIDEDLEESLKYAHRYDDESLI